MNEWDARIHKVLQQLELDDFSDLRFIQRREVIQIRMVGVKLIEYIEKKMAEYGITWGLYTADYFRENKDVLRGRGKPAETIVGEKLDSLIAVLERIESHLQTIAIYGRR